MNITEEEPMRLKEPNEVYLDIYKQAREKARKAKNEAIKAYLEAKRIKELYMLDVVDSSWMKKKKRMKNYLAKTKAISENFMFRLIYNEHCKDLKKLVSNQTFVVLAAIVAVAAVYYYSGFNTSVSSMAGGNAAAQAVDQVRDPNAGSPSDSQIQCAAGGNNYVPSQLQDNEDTKQVAL